MTKTTTKKKNTSSANKKNNTKNKQASAMAILTFFVVSVLLAIFMYIDSEGIVNEFIANILKGLFGNIAYAIPVSCLGMSIYFAVRKDVKRFKTKSLLLFFILCNISSITHLIYAHEGDSVLSSYNLGINGEGGGFLGAVVAYGLQVLFHDIASFVILLFILFILLSIFTRVSIFSATFSFFKGVFTDIRDDADNIQTIDNSETAANIKRKIQNRQTPHHDKVDEKDDILDISLDLPSEDDSSTNPENVSVIDEPPVPNIELHNVDVEQILTFDDIPESDTESEDTFDWFDFSNLNILDDSSTENTSDTNNTDNNLIFENEELTSSINSDDHTSEELNRASAITAEEQMVLNNEIENALDSPKEYIFPSLDLLTLPSVSDVDTRHEMHATATKLIEILKNFGVDAKLIQVSKGPSVTRYEIQPTVGTKLNKISALADDIALNLAAQNVLIAPVPDKAGVIGIEVPNREVAAVYVRELIESSAFTNAKSKLSVVLGKDIGGKPIVGDIAKMPHVLIAGQTGSGKSVCINTIITSILYKSTPDEVKMIMIDPKVVELGVYNGIPHLLIPVVTDPKRAAASLNWAVQEMMKRYELFAETGVRNLEGYNKLKEENDEKKLPQLLIIIDELADLMMVAAKEVEDYICRLAQLARAAGIHLIVATQRPSVDVITGLIKANVPSRIAFAVASQVDSRTILNYAGAEKLLGRGDMLYAPAGARSPLRVQGAFVTDGEVEKIVTFLKETSEQDSYSEDLAEHIERHSTGENGVTPDEEDDGDSLLPQAIELAVSMGQISTSMVQRKFRIGYARAGRIIDQMEARGIISGPNGSKPREVIIGHMDLSE